jgi:hypothetical protein
MIFPFSQLPGRHERHLRRKFRNPLFPSPAWNVTEQVLLDIQRRDHEELSAYLADLRDLVQRAVDLRPDEETQVVLGLKGELDRAYERAALLADDQTGNKEAIRKLIAVIMAAIRATAAGDPVAERELDDEEEARRIHFRLLEHPLVADLLDPGSLIRPDELAPSFLSDDEPAVRAALELFDGDQLSLLCREARSLLHGRDWLPLELAEAQGRLALLESRLVSLTDHRPRRESG